MKKIFTIIALAFIASIQTKAQGNLQFNAAKNISISGNFVIQNTSILISQDSIISVHNGKVWKIESASVNLPYNSTVVSLSLNGTTIQANVNSSLASTFPIWLSSGNHTLTLSSNNPGINKANVSIIEFNIIP